MPEPTLLNSNTTPADIGALPETLTGATAPAVNATAIGQRYHDTVADAWYRAKAVGSVTPADDWELDGGTVDNAAVVTALGGTPADSVTLSTTGGANKIIQYNADGNLVTGVEGVSGGGITMPDLKVIQWLKKDGTPSGQRIWGWDEHGGAPGTPELIIESPVRIAIIPYAGCQFGPNDAGRYPRYFLLSSGYASGAYAATEYMPSGALIFQTSVWTGAASVRNNITMQAKALDTSGTNSVLEIFDEAGMNEGGQLNTVGRGDVTGNVIAQVYREGIWTPGLAPEFTTYADGTITQTCSKYKTIQAATVTLTQNSTLNISGALEGMRGVIYVTQDGTGSWTLTPLGGTALDLTTGVGDVTDRVAWEYDGIFHNFTVQKNVNRALIIGDVDAAAFIAAALISVPTQKSAIVSLVESLKAASLWEKFYALYPFVGGTAAAHSVNLKTPGTYDITWSGGVTHNDHSTGTVTGDGINGYGNTNLNLNTLGAVNSAMAYVYSRTETLAAFNGYMFGATDATARFGLVPASSTVIAAHGPNDATGGTPAIAVGGTDYRKHFMLQRSDASNKQIRSNDTSVNSTVASTGAPNLNFFVLARNSSGSPSGYVPINYGAFAIGQHLTSDEWGTFRGIIDTFQTTLGRANP